MQAIRGLSALHMQVAPCKATLQSTSRHSQVHWSHWQRNSHCSGISTWPVPSRRVHMCQASDPSVHLTSTWMETCLFLESYWLQNNLHFIYKLNTDLSVWGGRIWVERCWRIFNWELDLWSRCWRDLYCDEAWGRCWKGHFKSFIWL